ncbi:Sensor kinase CckA [Rhodoplanes serenus]|uniref:histidine kinase n=2 Tax=Nitrobacteraceae TaxID=41294 RepID=A0A3S4F9L1_9BRAD|nr:Sensor kinase CckA [Rhodoplanes serenus]
MVVQAGLRLIGTKIREGAPASDVDALIHEIMQRTQNAQALTGQLLAFSRNQVLAPKIVNVNERIASIASILGQTLGGAIGIRTELNEDVGVVEVDADQLDVALLNLAVNGRDAMNGCGTLTIETSVAAGESGPEDQPDFIRITVKDTGIGMDAETKARAFEPFFTSKGDGKGTGLGLSQVYGFVVQSGGRVRIDSEVGAGTQVHLYLPRRPSDQGAQRNVTL